MAGDKGQPAADDPKAVLVADVQALLDYASERHLLTGDTTDTTQALQSNLVAPLSRAVADYLRAAGDDFDKRSLVLFYYSALSRLTAPVTGRSARCSIARKAFRSWTVWATFGMLVVAIGFEASAAYHAGKNPQAPHYVLDLVRPLAWGALGSCIFMLKSISDRVADFEFDERLLRGFITRVVIGGVLGMVVVKLFNINYDTQSLTPSAVAFLCGIGAKVIYGALENIIEALAERLTYSAFKKAEKEDAGSTAQTIPTPPPVVTPSAGLTTKPTAVIDDSQPFSILMAIKSQLAARGFNPGSVDSNPNPKTTEAIQAFFAKVTSQQVSADEVRKMDPLILLRWLRDNKVPTGWREKIQPSQDRPSLACEPYNADVEVLELLKGRKIGDGAPADADPQTLDRLVNKRITELIARDPTFAKLSFTEIRDRLKQNSLQP